MTLGPINRPLGKTFAIFASARHGRGVLLCLASTPREAVPLVVFAFNRIGPLPSRLLWRGANSLSWRRRRRIRCPRSFLPPSVLSAHRKCDSRSTLFQHCFARSSNYTIVRENIRYQLARTF